MIMTFIFNAEPCGKQIVSRKSTSRILGGEEITPHSEPWLTEFCSQIDRS